MTQHVIVIVHNLSAIRHTHKMQKRTNVNVNLTLATTVLLSRTADLLLAERTPGTQLIVLVSQNKL